MVSFLREKKIVLKVPFKNCIMTTYIHLQKMFVIQCTLKFSLIVLSVLPYPAEYQFEEKIRNRFRPDPS